jgi:hypothetical protein
MPAVEYFNEHEGALITLKELRDFLKEYAKHERDQKAASRYADAANANYYDAAGSGEEISLDDREWLTVSKGSDSGAWVSAWVWVCDENVKEWRKDRKRVEQIEARKVQP